MSRQSNLIIAMQGGFWDTSSRVEVFADSKTARKKARQMTRCWRNGLVSLAKNIKSDSLRRLESRLVSVSSKLTDWSQAPAGIRAVYEVFAENHEQEEAIRFHKEFVKTGRAAMEIISSEIVRKRQLRELRIKARGILRNLEESLVKEYEYCRVERRMKERKIRDFQLTSGAQSICTGFKKLGESRLADGFRDNYFALLALQVIKMRKIK